MARASTSGVHLTQPGHIATPGRFVPFEAEAGMPSP